MIRLVKAKDSDVAFLVALRKATMFSHLEQAGMFLSDEEQLQRVLYRFDQAHLIFFEEEQIGLLKFIETEEEVELLQLQISPQFQGKGLGSKVMRHYLELVKPLAKKISLKVLKGNPARKLYERAGFQLVGEDKYELFMELS